MTDPAVEPLCVVEEFLAADVEYTNIPMGTANGHAGERKVPGRFFAPIHEVGAA